MQKQLRCGTKNNFDNYSDDKIYNKLMMLSYKSVRAFPLIAKHIFLQNCIKSSNIRLVRPLPSIHRQMTLIFFYSTTTRTIKAWIKKKTNMLMMIKKALTCFYFQNLKNQKFEQNPREISQVNSP